MLVLAFAYNKNTLKRPIIGCGAILDGQPKAAADDLGKGWSLDGRDALVTRIGKKP